MDLAARRQALQQRFRELSAQVQQLNADALKVAGALELLEQLIQERDGQVAQADGARTTPPHPAYVADGT